MDIKSIRKVKVTQNKIIKGGFYYANNVKSKRKNVTTGSKKS